MRIGVLALQGDVEEHRRALDDVGADVTLVHGPDDLKGLDGIVLPGGESTTMSMLLESSGLGDPLGSAIDDGMAAFGTCAGMILLATRVSDGRADQRSYGAIDLTVRRNAFGRQLQSFECDLPVRCLGRDPLRAIFIRAPMVEEVGGGVEVVASLGQYGALSDVPVLCRQGRVLVAAFHPELTEDRRVHQLFVSMIEETEQGAA